ncbi:hypothetical protein [Amycolatopsis jejuensis]|uniref:hypothetical protein n=1 Tax=Amycolatopsis jejuensis TaxID=330084 RepID=UPI0005243CF3|nr:hypothetical protein [Amycolatopsis jejuensis]
MGREKHQIALFAELCSAVSRVAPLADAHIGIALAACDQIENKHRWHAQATEMWALSMPSPRDRSLIAALVAFYYAPLLSDVHVLLADDEEAERDVEMYRDIGEELGFGEVGLITPRQSTTARRSAYAASVTLGSVDAVSLDPPRMSTGLGIFRVKSAPESLQRRYRLASRLPEPTRLSLFPEEERRTADSVPCPEFAERRVKAIRDRCAGSGAELGQRVTQVLFSLQFTDRKNGKRVAADAGLLEALLAKHGRLDLLDAPYHAGSTPDGGYEIKFIAE